LKLLDELFKHYLLYEWNNDVDEHGLKNFNALYHGLTPALQEQGRYIRAQLEAIRTRTIIPFKGEMPDGGVFDVGSLEGKISSLTSGAAGAIGVERDIRI